MPSQSRHFGQVEADYARMFTLGFYLFLTFAVPVVPFLLLHEFCSSHFSGPYFHSLVPIVFPDTIGGGCQTKIRTTARPRQTDDGQTVRS